MELGIVLGGNRIWRGMPGGMRGVSSDREGRSGGGEGFKKIMSNDF